ncbi:MAG: hypothetical protein GX640_24035 [Fibrobacter sp.]|nr:hypothetical protein [Fibrobacter sp.]
MAFVTNVLNKNNSDDFFNDFLPFQKKVAFYGLFNSLSQCLLKITSPGICDFYQGTELWDLSMVDPDNRRPIDFSKRIAILNSIKKLAISEYPAFINRAFLQWGDGRIKMFIIYRCNKARQDRPELFQNAAYIPITFSGKYKEHCIGFARKYEEQWAITVVPKFLTSLIKENQQPLSQKIWEDTVLRLPSSSPPVWYNAITGEVISCEGQLLVGDLFKTFPGAFLISR